MGEKETSPSSLAPGRVRPLLPLFLSTSGVSLVVPLQTPGTDGEKGGFTAPQVRCWGGLITGEGDRGEVWGEHRAPLEKASASLEGVNEAGAFGEEVEVGETHRTPRKPGSNAQVGYTKGGRGL